jgi:hypothetical protein
LNVSIVYAWSDHAIAEHVPLLELVAALGPLVC